MYYYFVEVRVGGRVQTLRAEADAERLARVARLAQKAAS